MAEPQERISKETREVAQHDALAEHGAAEVPTPEEVAAADRYGDASSETKASYDEALERGANQQGEGRTP